jgi:hypothetical protein
MPQPTRREFSQSLLGALLAYGLIDTLFRKDALAAAVRPVIQDWMKELATLSQDLKDRKLKDLEFQTKLEELYGRCELPELIKLVDLDRLAERARVPERGAASVGIDLSKVEGLPVRLVFGKQVFICKQGRSIVPHGHDNMCTGFIVLRGDWAGKHYERVEDRADHYLIKPTIDRVFKPGECSTVSDHKDNVHWFKAESSAAFIFNIHVLGYNPDNPKRSGRVYLDPQGEKTAGGLIVAKKISSAEAHQKFG